MIARTTAEPPRLVAGCSRRGVKLSSAGVKLSHMLSLYSFDPR